jgi:hypothetical protein
MSVDSVLLAVKDVMNRIPYYARLHFTEVHDFGASDLGHELPPECANATYFGTATLLGNFSL